MKKFLITSMTALAIGAAFSNATFAADTTAAPPVHWSSKSISNAGNVYSNGKQFCHKHYIGKKTCIPGVNNSSDTLIFTAEGYNDATAQAGMIETLMGKDNVPSVNFTVQDNGKVIYTGPANNHEGLACNQDQSTKEITCSAWK